METKFNFNSQVCTSIEQSRRLLELGLKKETADMIHQPIGATPFNVWDKQEIEDDFYPAWSLHRLIEMLKNSRITISFIEKDTAIIVERYGVFQNVCEIWDNTYENICDAIEWLIKEGYFNKEYLV